MAIEKQFLNFPIQLLEGFMENPLVCLDNIFCYGVISLIKNRKLSSIEEIRRKWKYKISKEDEHNILEKGKILYDKFKDENFPYTGIHFKTYLRYLKSKTDQEYMCLLAFLALKSIIQTKPYQNTKNGFLYSRMVGSPRKTDNIPEKIKYWMESRYRRDKVFLLLEQSFHFVRTYKARGITYSFSLTKEALELAILKRKYEKSRKAITVEKRIAKYRAEEKLKEIYQIPSNGSLF